MEFALFIYFASIVEGLKIFFGVLATAFALYGLAICIDTEEMTKSARNLFIAAVAGTLIAVMIPNEKRTYLIAGAYVSQKIVESPKVQAVAGDAFELFNLKLKQYTEEVKKEMEASTKNKK